MLCKDHDEYQFEGMIMNQPTARKHYHDIDGARSLLMFLSVALHAGTVYAPSRPMITTNTARHEFFDWLISGFHLFVTPTFFFVGGFFSVLLLSRRSVGDFLMNRALRTVVPLVSIALTLNMVELYLRYIDTGGALSFIGWIGSPAFIADWASGKWQLHLWFLVSLVPMFMLAAFVQAVVPDKSPVRTLSVGMSDKFGGWIGGSAVFVLVLLGLAAANTANYAVASAVPGSHELIFPGFQTWYKLIAEFPFFVIGVMAALSPTFLANLCKWRAWMPLAAAAALILQPYPENGQSFVTAAAMLFANQLAIWTLVLFILQFFHRYFSAGGKKTAWLADCALSMYLFHHCLVYIFGRTFVGVDWPVWLEFLAVTAASAITVIMVHEYVIRRFAVARLLFNGKTDIRQIRATKQPSSDAMSTSVPPVAQITVS